jgi:hypothetical protein
MAINVPIGQHPAAEMGCRQNDDEQDDTGKNRGVSGMEFA